MTKGNQSKSPREIALDIIMDITETSGKETNFSHIVINNTLKEYDFLDKQDRGFITRICEGTLERIITIDYIINQYSNIKVKKMKPLIRSILRISVYQIKYMDRSPDFAICNEAVKITKRRGYKSLSGFVNGVLRNIIRKPEKVVLPDKEKEAEKYLSIKYSAPIWLVSQFIEQYGQIAAEAMLKDSLKEKGTSVRVNLNKTSVDSLMKELENEGVEVKKGSYLPYALKISNYDSIDRLESFINGKFTIQDESSMLVGEVANPKKDTLIIDVCAAPGGKTLHLAERLEGSGCVISRDISQQKIDLILENVLRLGLNNIKTQVHDAQELDRGLINKADLVMVDAPCSGLGVISKKPDIKYNMNPDKQETLVKLQRRILEVVQSYVKPGGVLIYSTCTVNKNENIENVHWFEEHFQFKGESIDEFLPHVLREDTTSEGYVTLIPGIHDSDGFFIARLRKM